MAGKAVYALMALALVSGCGEQDQAGESESSNDLIRSAETRVGAAEPLNRDQALAVMKQRHDDMETLGDEMKRVNNALKSSTPDVGQIRRSAATILKLAPDLVTWFPDGTGPGTGETHAKAEIWQTPDDFATRANEFVRAAENFDSAAKSGDLGQIEASFGALGKSCKACHDRYREKVN